MTTLLADDLRNASAENKRERETTFDYDYAQALARKRLRRELKRRDTIAGLPQPDETQAVAALRKRGKKRAAICETLRITEQVYARCVAWLKASKAERETREVDSHASIVGDIVSQAYLDWRFANFEGWSEREREAAERGEVCNPLSTEQAVKYAFGRYFRNERKRRTARAMRRSAKGSMYAVRALTIDLPATLPPQAARVASLLAHDYSKAEAADNLEVSRPRVSAIVRQLAELPAFIERAALLGILPHETRAACEAAEAGRVYAKRAGRQAAERAAQQAEAARVAFRGNLAERRYAWRCSAFVYGIEAERAALLPRCVVGRALRTIALGYAPQRSPLPQPETREVVTSNPQAEAERAALLAACRVALPGCFAGLSKAEADDLAAKRERAALRVAELKRAEIDKRNAERAALRAAERAAS